MGALIGLAYFGAMIYCLVYVIRFGLAVLGHEQS